MKTRPFLILASLMILACRSGKDLPYLLPPEMAPAVKVEFSKQCDKGKILYELNCSSCHNIKVRKKSVIPDFSPEQLIGYELRVSNAKHLKEIQETRVTAEDFGLIMTFLSYKTKSNIDLKGNPKP